MATPMIKTTYALDSETIRALEEMATRWGVSKSEALRRAIRAVARRQRQPDRRQDALVALEELQRSLRLTRAKASAWIKEVRAERSAVSARREGRRR